MEIGEAIAVAVMTTPKEDCWFCKEERKADDPKNDLDEDPDSKGKPENQLQNDSSKLGQALGHRPSWSIVVPKMTEPVGVVPAAHHLVPGNASLKKVTKLLKYMKAGEKVSGDIGYDVNSRQNGVWLPGSYGVTEKSALQQKWSAYEYQDLYAVEAMKRARAQFHDSHPTYSEKVKKTLSCIADRIIANHPVKCPGCGKTLSEKARPPYGLVGRLNTVSRNHRRFLTGPIKKWPVGSGYFTSKRSSLMKTAS